MTEQSITRRRHPLLRRRGARAPLALEDEMNRLMTDFLGDWGLSPVVEAASRGWSVQMPRIDLSETDGQIKVSAELPGVKGEDVSVEIEDDILTISGERSEEQEEEEGTRWYQKEHSYGAFRRDVVLPTTVKPEGAEARFRDGILSVTMPKTAADETKRRKIKITD